MGAADITYKELSKSLHLYFRADSSFLVTMSLYTTLCPRRLPLPSQFTAQQGKQQVLGGGVERLKS